MAPYINDLKDYLSDLLLFCKANVDDNKSIPQLILNLTNVSKSFDEFLVSGDQYYLQKASDILTRIHSGNYIVKSSFNENLIGCSLKSLQYVLVDILEIIINDSISVDEMKKYYEISKNTRDQIGAIVDSIYDEEEDAMNKLKIFETNLKDTISRIFGITDFEISLSPKDWDFDFYILTISVKREQPTQAGEQYNELCRVDLGSDPTWLFKISRAIQNTDIKNLTFVQ